MDKPLVLGIDIGGTHIRLGLVTEDYEVLGFHKEKSQPVLETSDPLGKLETLVKDFVKANNAQVKAASIGFPSTIDAARKVVVSTPNIKSLQNLKVVEDLGARLKVPVFINRDVNYILLSDLEDLKERMTPRNVCGFYIGTGLGNTIMIEGRLLIGKHGTAAELGHLHVPGFTGKCGCGGEGCIELLAGGLALAKIREEYYPDTAIEEIFTLYRNTKPLKEYIKNLASAVASEIVIIDPDVSIFGGGVVQMKDFPKEDFENCIYSYARRPCPQGSLKFIYVKDSQESGVRGAGIYAYKRLADPTYL